MTLGDLPELSLLLIRTRFPAQSGVNADVLFLPGSRRLCSVRCVDCASSRLFSDVRLGAQALLPTHLRTSWSYLISPIFDFPICEMGVRTVPAAGGFGRIKWGHAQRADLGKLLARAYNADSRQLFILSPALPAGGRKTLGHWSGCSWCSDSSPREYGGVWGSHQACSAGSGGTQDRMGAPLE